MMEHNEGLSRDETRTKKGDNMASITRDVSLSFKRKLYTIEGLDQAYPTYTPEQRSLSQTIRTQCTCTKKKAWKSILSIFPIIKFIVNYKIKEYPLGDFLSGLTVSFMHLPQGLGFGILAGLQPVHGLYSTFFPVLIYMFFGTSPHVSFGTNAVMALLTQTVVENEASLYISKHQHSVVNHSIETSSQGTDSSFPSAPSAEDVLALKIGTAMTSSLLVGIMLAGLGILRLGFITTYLSVSFISAFTTAAAIHISSSQVPKMFGVNTESFSGAGKLIRFYIDFFSKIDTSNIAEIVITVICIAILLIIKICINEKFKSKMKMPIPIDLIVVIIGTVISHFANFKDNFNVHVVGSIPSGIPSPKVPSFDSAGRIVTDCVIMAVLSLAMTISMAKVTAAIHGITINDNQELIAYGLSNIGSSFFACFPQSTAPPRTMILSSLGAKTTLNAIATSIVMLLVLLLIGHLFEALPISVLAAMIIAAMKDLLLQFRELPTIFKINKYDFFIWIITCSVSVLVDLPYGIIAGIAVSILFVVIQHQMATGQILGVSASEDILLNTKYRHKLIELKETRIFQFQAPLYFSNAERFKRQLYSLCGNPIKILKRQSKDVQISIVQENGSSKLRRNNISVKDDIIEIKGPSNIQTQKRTSIALDHPKHVILDCQMMTYIDMAGVNVLRLVVKDYRSIDTMVLLARIPVNSLNTLHAAEFFKSFPKECVFYDSLDAVEAIRRKLFETTRL